MSNKDDYEVGYKKPPAHTRFKAGQSGNPKGRKKGSVNLPEAFRKELNKKIKIREGDQELEVRKIDALAKSIINGALKSNRHSVTDVLKVIERHFSAAVDDGPQTTADLLEEDKKLFEMIAARRKEVE